MKILGNLIWTEDFILPLEKWESMEEYLVSICEALSSNQSIANHKQTNEGMTFGLTSSNGDGHKQVSPSIAVPAKVLTFLHKTQQK